MKKILILSLCMFSCIQADAQKQEDLIRQFVTDLFNTQVPIETVVEKYLVELKDEENATSSLEERNEIQLNHIKVIRKQLTDDEVVPSWLVPNKSNANPENVVAKYLDYKELDQFGFSESKDKEVTKNIYVLLNKDRSEILQYFYVENGKIKYFTLLVKGGGVAYFFGS